MKSALTGPISGPRCKFGAGASAPPPPPLPGRHGPGKLDQERCHPLEKAEIPQMKNGVSLEKSMCLNRGLPGLSPSCQTFKEFPAFTQKVAPLFLISSFSYHMGSGLPLLFYPFPLMKRKSSGFVNLVIREVNKRGEWLRLYLGKGS